MINLYTQSGLKDIEKLKKYNLFLMCLFIGLSIVSFILFIVFATYKTRVLFANLCSIITTVLVFIFIYFLFKHLHIKRIQNEYSYLLDTKRNIIECQIIECSNYLTTLPDKSKCYEVMVSYDGREVIYYLSEIFDINDIKVGTYKLDIFNDYIKGYEYED